MVAEVKVEGFMCIRAPFQQASINRVAVWAIEESVVDEVESKFEADELNEQQRKTLDECLGKWQEVLINVPGKTEVLLHDIKTGEAPPIRSVPYQIPDKWREQVREEISKLSDAVLPGLRIYLYFTDI